jgi:hypothetical protein
MNTRQRWRELFLMGVLVVVAASKGAGAEFSETLSSDEFSAAGLSKLSAEELSRLNALIQRQRRSDGERKEQRTSGSGTTGLETSSPTPSAKASARERVVLTPGTAVEYAKVETHLRGRFRGYEPGAVLTLANGQRWRVVDGSYWAPAKDADKLRKVVIEPGVLGSFFLRIEDGGRPKVKYVGPAS